jgi:16S rRNA (cytosine1402-N4)-methyltransferase
MAKRLIASVLRDCKVSIYSNNNNNNNNMKLIRPIVGTFAAFSSTASTSSGFIPTSIPTGFRRSPSCLHHPKTTRASLPFEGRTRTSIARYLSTEKKDNEITTTTEQQQDAEQTKSFATSYHAPVMWSECVDSLLECQRGRIRKDNNTHGEKEPLVFVDGTLGGGGHSAALLEGLEAGDVVFGCDVDPTALETASRRLQDYMNHDGTERPLFVPIEANFCHLAKLLPTILHPVTQDCIAKNGVDGMLLDLGVSSHQIDTPERGFAFMKDGPLDMRMGPSAGALTAADICNEFDAKELQRIFSRYGDEPRSKTLALAIVNHRPLSTTAQLVDAIASVTHKFAKHKRKGRTATCARIFQSLRIVVNREDQVLEGVLSDTSPTLIRTGGRLVVLSYHSMEDRATKRIMRDGTTQRIKQHVEKDIYGNDMGPPKPFKPVGKRQTAKEEEVEVNPRARSASLRVAERMEGAY